MKQQIYKMEVIKFQYDTETEASLHAQELYRMGYQIKDSYQSWTGIQIEYYKHVW